MTGVDIYLQNTFSDAAQIGATLLILAAVGLRSRAEKRWGRRRYITMALRASALFILLMAAQNPMFITHDVKRKAKTIPLILDDSLSMLVQAGGDSRWVQAVDAADKLGRSALGERFQLPIVRLSHPRSKWIDDVGGPGMPKEKAGLPEARQSRPLEAVGIQTLSGEGERRPAVVLLSDGRSSSTLASAAYLPRSVPVYVLMPKDARTLADTRVLSLEGPRLCRKGDTAMLSARIFRTGGSVEGGVEWLVNDSPVAREDLHIMDGSTTLTTQVKFEESGWFRVGMRLTESDDVDRNNPREVMVEVVDQPLNVLLVSGSSHYDFRYLRDSLDRDPLVKLAVHLQNAEKDHPGWGDIPLREFPSTEAELAAYDAVVLQDIDMKQVGEPALRSLTRYVEDLQGALLIQAGVGHNFPSSARGTALEPLLPHVPGELSEDPAGFILEHKEEGLLAPPDGVGRIVFTRFASSERLLTGSHVVWTSDKGDPLLTWCRRGRGKVGFMAVTDWWRVRLKGGDIPHYGFFSSFIRFLAEDRYSGQGKRCRIRMGDEGVLESDGDVTVHVELLDSRFRPYEATEVPCTLKGPGDQIRPLILPAESPGIFSTRVQMSEPGRISLNVEWESEVFTHHALVQEPQGEFEEMAPDKPAMEALAASTGGKVFVADRDGVQALVKELQGIPDLVASQSSRPFWNLPWVAIPLLLLLLAEWTLRRAWSQA
ncbi:MAG: hypothetical protein AB7F75_09435 [Planctomycetota bacterium]